MELFKKYKMFFMVAFILLMTAILYLVTGDISPVLASPVVIGLAYSNTFLYRMPSGIAGDLTRKEWAVVESGIYDSNYPCLLYGILIKYVSGKVRPIAAADVIASVQQGFLVRTYPLQDPMGTTQAAEAPGGSIAPNLTLAASILKSGYMTVQLGNTGGTVYQGLTAYANIAKGDQVYCRKTVNGAGLAGDLEAGSVTGNEAITNCFFLGPADSNGNTEIAFNV